MSWGGVDAIPMLPGESRNAAIDRVYGGGVEFWFEDGYLVSADLPGPDRDITRVSSAERHWMLDAARMLEQLRPGWRIAEEHREPGRRWPWSQELEHPEGSMWIKLGTDHINFRRVRYGEVDDHEWAFWWRTIRRFARLPAAIFHPDTGDIVAPSLSAAAARARYNWL